MDVITSGYAGVLPNGNIVDRREFPDALSVQKNEMFNVPKPKKIEKEICFSCRQENHGDCIGFVGCPDFQIQCQCEKHLGWHTENVDET